MGSDKRQMVPTGEVRVGFSDNSPEPDSTAVVPDKSWGTGIMAGIYQDYYGRSTRPEGERSPFFDSQVAS